MFDGAVTHWGRVTHICVSKLSIIGLVNGLSPGRRQAIFWTNDGILLIRTLGTNFSEILSKIHSFSFKKMHLKMLYAKWWPCCLGLNAIMMIKLQKQRSKIVIHLMLLKRLHELKVVSSSKFSVKTRSLSELMLPWFLTLPGGHFKNTYELLNLRAFKFSPLNKIYHFQCMGKIFCVEFQRYPLKFHTQNILPLHWKIWFLYNIEILRALRFKSSYAFLAATKQLYEWYFLSVCPSVRLSVRLSVCPSVRLSHLFDYVPIIVSSWNFQELSHWTRVRSMQKVKVRGQRSRSQRSRPKFSFPDCNSSLNSHMMIKLYI